MSPKRENPSSPEKAIQIPGLHTRDVGLQKLYNQDIQSREQDMQNNINRMKQEKAQFRLKKNEEEEALADLIKEIELKKERDLRARIEKDQIKKDLVDLEKQKLTGLEMEKKAQLETLAAERENLRQKETQLVEDIAKLENDYKDMNKIRDEAVRRVGGDALDKLRAQGSENLRAQEFLMQERSDRIAELKLRREHLEFERARIMNEKDKVRNGNYSSPQRPNYALQSVSPLVGHMNGIKNYSVDNARLRASADMQRINQMKVNELRNRKF